MLFHSAMRFFYHKKIWEWAETSFDLFSSSAKNQPKITLHRNLNTLAPKQATQLPRGANEIYLPCTSFLNNKFIKLALGKGLEGVEVGGEIKVLVCSNTNQKLGLTQGHLSYNKEIWQWDIQTKQLNPIDLSSGKKTYFEWPDHCQKMKYWWKDSHCCHPVSQRILLSVWGITALSWLEYCSLVSVFLHGIFMTMLFVSRWKIIELDAREKDKRV